MPGGTRTRSLTVRSSSTRGSSSTTSANYPNLTRLFRELGVETQPSEMSFAMSCGCGLEWSSRRPWRAGPRLLREILRFLRTAGDADAGRQVVRPLPARRGLLRLVSLALPGADDLRPLVDRSGGRARVPRRVRDRVLPQSRDARAAAEPLAHGHRRQPCLRAGAARPPRRAGAAGDRPCARSRRTVPGSSSGLPTVRSHAFDGAVVATSAPRALALLEDASAEEREILVGVRDHHERDRAAHRRAPAAAPHLGPLVVELPVSRLRRARREALAHVLAQPAPEARLGGGALRHAQPHGRDRPVDGDSRDRLRAPADDVREPRGGRARPGPRRACATPPSPARGRATASTRTGSRRGCGPRPRSGRRW